jgi:probable HAF family extracellular repeat protein
MSHLNRQALRQLYAIIVLLGAPAVSACGGPSPTLSALPSQVSAAHPELRKDVRGLTYQQFTYQTLDDPYDATTEILGVNNLGKICGYYGSPYTGFLARRPYQKFRKLIYPGAADTVIAAVDNQQYTAGWYKDSKGRIFGLTFFKGFWQTYQDPKLLHSGKSYTELLGLEDGGVAVGFYQDKSNVDHAFEVDIATTKYHAISPPGAVSAAATGINNKGDVVGWATLADGTTGGWLFKGGQFTEFEYPKAVSTVPTSVNWSDDIVGSFKGKGDETHGFILTDLLSSQTWQQIDEPLAHRVTVIEGINNHDTMVGYYQDDTGNINGFIGTPQGAATR